MKDLHWIKLTQQQRCKSDLIHTEFIEQLGNGISVTTEMLSRYKVLSRDDMEDKSWRYAPVLVATNRERIDIIHQQSIMFAIEHHTHVIIWPVNYTNWINRPKSDTLAIMNDPVFWQYFVVGAEMIVSSNINTDLGIANGTMGICHSITMKEHSDTVYLRNQIQSQPIGSIISLTDTPMSINIELFKGQISKTKSWDRETLIKEKVVIPLIHEKKFCKKKRMMVQGGVSYGYQPSHVYTTRPFPFELGFSITIHKTMSKTFDKVILSLSDRPS